MKIVILDGRPMFADRAGWSGLDRFGEVELYQASRRRRSPLACERRRDSDHEQGADSSRIDRWIGVVAVHLGDGHRF